MHTHMNTPRGATASAVKCSCNHSPSEIRVKISKHPLLPFLLSIDDETLIRSCPALPKHSLHSLTLTEVNLAF